MSSKPIRNSDVNTRSNLKSTILKTDESKVKSKGNNNIVKEINVMTETNTNTIPKTELVSDNVINTFDFSSFDEINPILEQGHSYCLKELIDLEVRKINTKIEDQYHIAIMKIGEEQYPSSIRIELSSEKDIFFYYLSEFDMYSFKKMQETQKLGCAFGEFIATLRKLILTTKKGKDKEIINNNFDSIKTLKEKENIKSNHLYKLVLNCSDEDNIRLEFVKLLGHKEIVVLSINFLPISDDFKKRIIMFKFNYTRSKMIVYQDRLNFINNLLKTKNSALYEKAKKIPSRLTLDYIQSKIEKEEVKLDRCLDDIDFN